MKHTHLLLPLSLLVFCCYTTGCSNATLSSELTAARSGDAQAQFELGLRYGNGRGVDHDANEAEHWIRQAADNGHPDAQFFMGEVYGHGFWVDHDAKQAEHWYRLAAESGHNSAQQMLGESYAHGYGVPKDLVEGYKWLYIATKHGQTDNGTLTELQASLSAKDLEAGKARALEWEKNHPGLHENSSRAGAI